MSGYSIVDLFAGPGGWELALKRLAPWYYDNTLGIEYDNWTVATRLAAGHKTLQADVSKVDPFDYEGLWGLIASPPCRDFSQANPKQLGLNGDSGRLTEQVIRWADALRPEWIACEQVRKVLPIWEQYGEWLRQHGYSVWTGVLNAADYGVAQTRKRAILIASRRRHVSRPEPLFAEKGATDGMLPFPWRTMAAALPHRTDLPAWCHQRPSTTVVGSFKPEVQAAPGYRKKGDTSRQNTPGSVILSHAERLTLQSFPADYPVQGPKTAKDRQIGDVIPATLAAFVLAEATGIPFV